MFLVQLSSLPWLLRPCKCSFLEFARISPEIPTCVSALCFLNVVLGWAVGAVMLSDPFGRRHSHKNERQGYVLLRGGHPEQCQWIILLFFPPPGRNFALRAFQYEELLNVINQVAFVIRNVSRISKEGSKQQMLRNSLLRSTVHQPDTIYEVRSTQVFLFFLSIYVRERRHKQNKTTRT